MKARVKNYSRIVKKAPAKLKVKGKVTIRSYGGYCGAGYTGGFSCCGHTTTGAFTGFSGPSEKRLTSPSMQQRLLGWAEASKLVTVNLENSSFQGFIIGVDGNAFEVSVVNPLTSNLVPGSIVTVNFWQVNSVGVTS